MRRFSDMLQDTKTFKELPHELRMQRLSWKDLSDDVLHQAVRDKVAAIKHKALEHPNIKPEHIDVAMKDKSVATKLAILKSPAVQDHHLEQLSKHLDPVLSREAKNKLIARRKMREY